jgi:hypothetical protein
MNNGNILTACSAVGLKPICDYASSSYNDGQCLTPHAGTYFHFSYGPHNDDHGIPRNKVVGAFFYAGRANGQWSFLNQGYTHRWSNTYDRDGDTFCGKKGADKPNSFTFKGHLLVRTKVSGSMTDSNVRTACNNIGLKPLCDHSR